MQSSLRFINFAIVVLSVGLAFGNTYHIGNSLTWDSLAQINPTPP